MNIFTFHSSHYSPVCAQYSDFLYKAQLLTQKLLKQDYIAPRLKSLLYNLTVVITNCWPLRTINSSSNNGTFTLWVELCPLSPTRRLPDLAMSNLAGVVYEIGTAYLSRTLDFNLNFWWGPCCSCFYFFCFLCHWIVFSWMSCGFH